MKNETLKWLWRVPGRKKGLIAALTAAQILSGGTGVLYALLLRNIVNSAAAGDGEGFRQSAVVLLLLVVFALSLSALIRWLSELSRASIENILKLRLTEHILDREYGRVSTVHTAEWLNRLTGDAAVTADGYADILPGLARTAVRLLSALILLIVLDSAFALVILPGGALLTGLAFLFRKKLRKLNKRVREEDGQLRIFLQERIAALPLIRVFCAERQTAEGAEAAMEGHLGARMRKNRFSNFCSTGFGAAMHGMNLFGILYCAWGILSGRVSYGTLIAVMQLIGQIEGPLANISGYLPRWYAMTASAERLMEIEGFPPDTEEEALSDAEIRAYYEEHFASLGFRDADFAYGDRKEQKVFRGLNLMIRKGETVAFTGRSGCGKSTALKLLTALYSPERGECFVDDRPLTAAWRRLFACVPQGGSLLQGTVREIVAFADPAGAGDEERLRRALRIACAEEFVDELPRGVDTELGETGAGLSEGQMQRLAVARAIFADRPVLLLDEASSALDERTERRMLENIRGLTDKTVVLVTHHTAVLSACDRVLRFTENGVKEA